MSESHDLGVKGEELATDYLKNNGFRILGKNWKWGKNEIDIIAEDSQFIIFVEVKTRTDEFLEHPVNAVTREKQKSIIFAADGYLRINRIDKESRFDIITVIIKKDDFSIDHIKDAFYPTLR
jgi:putative endonuclease